MPRNSLKLAGLALALVGASAFAQNAPVPPADGASKTPLQRQDARQARQQANIASGAAGGQLTAQETQHLEKAQHRTDMRQERAMADGQMSAEERRRIHRSEVKNAKAIKRLEDNQRGKQP